MKKQTKRRVYNVKKTSSKWLHTDDFSDIIIIKPYGWPDDPNLFVNEKITKAEFEERLSKSVYRKREE
jgi:hypothetical protein